MGGAQSMFYQQTLNADFSCSGIGLHSGKKVNLTVSPAPSGFGIQFVRTDLRGKNKVKVGPSTVSGTSFATTISGKDFYISTVEHLMSALVGMGVDNAIVKIDGEEVPIMDGSAAPFACLIASVGLRRQSKPRLYMEIVRPIMIREAGKSVALYPHDGFRVDCEIDFEHPAINTQRLEIEITPESYISDIAPARTFGFLSEISMLQANGLAAGGGLDNAVVLGDYSVLNKGGLRFPDEFVRHKILDSLGDLYLAGMPILGRFVAYKSGHGLNNRLARKLMTESESWRIVERAPQRAREFVAGMPAAAWAR